MTDLEQQARDEDAAAAMARVLSTREGRRWVWSLLGTTGVYATSHTQGDPHQTAFNEGRRAVGTTILLDVMKHEPAAYARMMDEAREDAERYRAIADRNTDADE